LGVDVFDCVNNKFSVIRKLGPGIIVAKVRYSSAARAQVGGKVACSRAIISATAASDPA